MLIGGAKHVNWGARPLLGVGPAGLVARFGVILRVLKI